MSEVGTANSSIEELAPPTSADSSGTPSSSRTGNTTFRTGPSSSLSSESAPTAEAGVADVAPAAEAGVADVALVPASVGLGVMGMPLTAMMPLASVLKYEVFSRT